MRYLHFFLLTSLFVFLLLFSNVVYAGSLTAIREEVADGTRFTIFWRQGFNTGNVYYYHNAFTSSRILYKHMSNLNLGPNSCNVLGAQGNDRAVYALVSSDADGPNYPDAIVNCNFCPCEDNPETYFRCRTDIGSMQYRCEQCNACDSNPCPSGQTCTHVDCDNRTCSGCDDIVCESQTTSWGPWSECDAPSGTALPGNSCGPTSGTETRSRTVYSCVGADCVGSTETESRSCSGYIGCSGRWDCTGSCSSYVSGTCTGYSCGYSCSSGTCAQSCDLGMMQCVT